MATTKGFVQRLSWLAGGPTACAWVGPTPASATAFLVAVRAADGAARIRFKQSLVAVLGSSLATGRELAVSHAVGSSEILGLATVAPNVAATPVQVDAVEVTQAIQDLGGSIPLVAGKRTVVRVYLSHYGGLGITVEGTIAIRRGPTDPEVLVASESSVALNPAHAGQVPPKRDDASRSLNFVLPSTHTGAGPLAIRIAGIVDTVTATQVAFGGERRPTVRFHESAPIRVRVLGMRYTQDGATHTPSALDFDLLSSWLLRAMPAGQLFMSTAIVDATAAVPFGCGSINAQIAAIRAIDVSSGTDARTHYYGLVSDGGFFMRGCAAGIPQTPQPQTVASGPTGGATWGWDLDGSYGDWYTGHELGHTYGRRHPGFCGETQSDLDNFPFVNGQLANSDMSFGGFDVGDPGNGLAMSALPGTQWHDVMTYCDRQWLCAYTYRGIRRRLAAEDDLSAGPSPGPPSPGPSPSGGRPDRRFPRTTPPRPTTDVEAEAAPEAPSAEGVELGSIPVSIVATVNLTRGSGEIEFVNPLERSLPYDTPAEAPASLRIKGAGDEMLGEHPAEVKLSSELGPDDERKGIVDAVVEVDPSARSIELVLGGEVVDTYPIGGGPPAVRAARMIESGARDVRVTADLDAASGAARTRYTVQVSTDAGRSWQTVGVGLADPSVTLDREQFTKGQSVRVRVLATDGLRTSVVTTEALEM